MKLVGLCSEAGLRYAHLMTLIINCIADETARSRFDSHTVPRLATVLGSDNEVRYWGIGGPLGSSEGHDRILLSGSELSAANEEPRDEELFELIRSFADQDNPILGICYGHQMVARALGGKCRRAATPEFGWKKVSTKPNPIFEGLENLVTLHSHYDEVYDLPTSFQTIGSTIDCEVQAFQVSGRPIWGVQFHPEMGFVEGQSMLDSNLRTEPLAPQHYVDELQSPQQADDNLRLFANFASIHTKVAALSQ